MNHNITTEKIINPENNADNSVLKSVHNEKRKGFLYAEWNDKKYDWQEIIDGYYVLFERLRRAGVICSESLKINGKRIYGWNNL